VRLRGFDALAQRSRSCCSVARTRSNAGTTSPPRAVLRTAFRAHQQTLHAVARRNRGDERSVPRLRSSPIPFLGSLRSSETASPPGDAVGTDAAARHRKPLVRLRQHRTAVTPAPGSRAQHPAPDARVLHHHMLGFLGRTKEPTDTWFQRRTS
jgi:hypothetical protein